MMEELTREERKGWLALVNCGLERRFLAEAIKETSSPLELLQGTDRELAVRFRLSRQQIEKLRELPPERELLRQEELLDRHGIRIVPVCSPEYPRNLFNMRVAPPAIFVKGAIEEIDRLAVGIVGPRVPTNYGMEVARMLARDFAPTLTVVSGAALGIDSAVHQEVLEHGGRTLAVLGCGIDQNYPARNEPLRRRIGEGREGALISIFPPGSRPLRGNFPQRNFVLAGLCLAVVVVEASATSGALVTARAAGEEGRPVYAVPGDITRRNSAGSNALLRDGATACTSATDVLADLQGMLAEELEMLRERRAQHGLTIAPATAGEDAPRSEADSPVEAMVLRVIQHSTISHDDLINQFVPGNMSMGDLSTALLMLELKGKIQQLPGRFYGPRL